MLYWEALQRVLKDRLAFACLVIIVIFTVLALLSNFEAIAGDPNQNFTEPDEVTQLDRSYHPPTLMLAFGAYDGLPTKANTQETKERLDNVFEGGLLGSAAWHLPLGADRNGRSIFKIILHGIRLAFVIGIVTTLISIIIAVPMGALAGYFGGWVDDLVVWFYTTLASIPFLLLLIAIMATIPEESKAEKGLTVMLIAIGTLTWVGLARLIRAEFLKHKVRDYVLACKSLGYGHTRTIFKHILPNTMHIVIITFTLGFVMSVNIEVFLTFVGVGVPSTEPTFGQIFSEAKGELTRDPSVWWPLTSATVFLFVLSLAFSIFGDALRDALDPKLRTG